MTPTTKERAEGSDLDGYRTLQGGLYGALVAFQSGNLPLAAHGLAMYHRIGSDAGHLFIEGVLAHVDGGSITSGPILVDSPQAIQGARELSALLLTGKGGFTVEAVSVAADTHDAEPEPAAAQVRELTEEEREDVRLLFDQLAERDPDELKAIGTELRAHFQLGKVPLARAFTTTAHAEWIHARVTPLLADDTE